MSSNKRIKDLLDTVPFDKKRTDSLLVSILSDICFEIMDDISRYIYMKKTVEAEYNSYCGVIFNRIDDSVKKAHRSKTFEEYVFSIEDCVRFVTGIASTSSKKNSFFDGKVEDPILLLELREKHKRVYDKFFVKKRKRKVKKNVR